MKNLLTILFITFCIISCKPEFKKAQHIPSKIDSLNTEKEIESYIRLNKDFEDFELKYEFKPDWFVDSLCKIVSDSLKLKDSFYKGDFDNNGYTDLLFTGLNYRYNSKYYEVNALMNFDKDSVRIVDLRLDEMEKIVFRSIKKDNRDLVEIYAPDYTTEWIDKNKGTRNFKYQLTYVGTNFIEYNKTEQNYTIEKIEYFKRTCGHRCPIFDITIKNDLSTTFMARQYNFGGSNEPYDPNRIEDLFTTTLQKEKYEQIVNILNHMNFTEITGGDQENLFGFTLKITYNNGKIKTIHDDSLNLISTYGKKAIMEYFYDLRETQKWTKIQKS